MELYQIRYFLAVAETLIHVDDALRLGICDADTITVRSAHGEILSIARVTATIRPGVVSCSHGRGMAGTGCLVDLADIDPLTSMPIAGGVPVSIRQAADGPAGAFGWVGSWAGCSLPGWRQRTASWPWPAA